MVPEGIEYVSLPHVQSVRCARRVTPDGAVVFDLIAEVLQSGTVRRDGVLFDFNGGCTVVIDPSGQVRYVIYKSLGSAKRLERQHEAMHGSLKRLWKTEDERCAPVPDVARVLDGER